MTDAQQFEVFVRNYQNMVYSVAMRLLANTAEAQDVAQEVFLRAYKSFGALRDNPSAGGWLKTVATHLSLNHLARYRSRWSFFSEIEDGGDGTDGKEQEFQAADDVEAIVSGRERSALVEEALRRLPPAFRVPLVLYHLEGMSCEEIAAQLGVSLGKVKTDLFRGRELLRRKLRVKLDVDAERMNA